MKLLDTTFLAHYFHGDSRVETFLEAHDEAGGTADDLVTTTINVEETAVGMHVVGDEPTVSEVESELGWLTVLPFETVDAVRSAAIEAELVSDDNVAGDRIDALTADVLIAGAAARRGTTVVTQDADDFEMLGVPVETY